MAIIQQKQSSGFDMKDIASLLSVAGPLFGSGKQVSETTGDPSTNGNAQQLIASLMGGIDPAAMDGVISSIFQKGKAAFGPQLFAGAGGGAYNSTVQQQLAGEALARATAEASSAKLSATSDAQRTAAGLINGMQGANRRTVTQTGASPLGKIGSGVLTALQARSMFGKKKPPLDAAKMEELAKGSIEGIGAEDAAMRADVFGAGNNFGVDASAGSLGAASDLPAAGEFLSFFAPGQGGANLAGDFGSVASMLDFGDAATLTDFGSLASDFGSASAMLDFGGGAADAAGVGLDFGFPGMGTLINFGSRVLSGESPDRAVGSTLESLTESIGSILDSLFDW